MAGKARRAIGPAHKGWRLAEPVTDATAARRPAEVVATNVHAWRSLHRMSQQQLAEMMRDLGHAWHQQTVSNVEGHRRPVNVDELVSLAVVLAVPVSELLRPAGVDGRNRDGIVLGDIDDPGATYLPHDEAMAVLYSRPAGSTDDEKGDQ